MEWYQVQYCKSGYSFWSIYGGRDNPFKFASRDDAMTGETEIMKRFPGCTTMIIQVREVLYSDLETGDMCQLREYSGSLQGSMEPLFSWLGGKVS